MTTRRRASTAGSSGLASVLVVDDDSDLRLLVRMALERGGRYHIVGEAGDGGSAISAASRLDPDLIVLDMGLPDMEGMQVLAAMVTAAPSARVIVFSGLQGAPLESAALAVGAASYVLKSSDVSALLAAMDEHRPDVGRSAVIELPHDLSSIAEARRLVRDSCELWGCAELCDDAVLVTSELVANAILHGGTGARVVLRLWPEALRVEVRDVGAGAPSPRAVDADSESGRGVYLVAALTRSWGVDPLAPTGKTVWAEIPRGEDRRASG